MANPENVVPYQVKPGEIKNPTGKNQYTYRSDAEKHLDDWCREYGRDLVRKVADAAKAGKPWAAKLLLDRILPAVTQHEVNVTEPAGIDALVDRLAGIASKKRSNGSADGAEPRRTNGGNGSAL